MACPQFQYQLYSSEDQERFIDIISSSYVVDKEQVEDALNSFDQQDIRTLYHHDLLIGALGIIPTAQYFGRKKVSMTGVSSLAIAPEFRGQGGASYLMRSLLGELSNGKVAISTLYPALPQLYRKFGYNFSGGNYTWQIPLEQISIPKTELTNSLRIRETSLDINLLDSLYRQQAQVNSGYIARNHWFWLQLVSGQQKVAIYLIEDTQQVHGYFICEYKMANHKRMIGIKDWVLLTHQAIGKFWQFLSFQRSQIQLVEWRSASRDQLSLGLDYPSAEVTANSPWAIRIINLPLALSQRGYPQSVSAELHWQIEDRLLSGNNGNFILKVADGEGMVQQGGTGSLQIAIADFAPMFTGFSSAKSLAQLGLLKGDPQSVAIADTLFSGNSPWMLDFF